jgi:transcriptional regulator with XRE-family HTH domain
MVQVETIHAGNTVETVVKTVKERSNMVNAREAIHLTQWEVAKGMQVNVRTVKGWENATHTPYLRHVEKLRGILKWTGTDADLLQVFEVPVDDQEPVNESQYALGPLEEPMDTQESEKELLALDELRRKTLEKIVQAAGIGFIPGTALLSAPIIGPDEYLEQCSIAIEECWQHLNHGDIYKVERTLNAHLPTLTQYANTESDHQQLAAGLMVQAKVIQMILATWRNDAAGRARLCIDAVRFGRITGNPFAIATALDWQGSTYICLYRQPQLAIDLFNDAISGIGTSVGSSDAMLNRSSIYSGLAIAHAQKRSETDAKENRKLAFDYIELAYKTMPSKPELEPFSRSISMGTSELDQSAGEMYLFLAEHFPNDGYGKLAYELFNSSLSKQALSMGYRGQTLIRKADSCIAVGKMDEYEACMREGLTIAIKINSHKRMSEIDDVVSHIPPKWQRETAIQTLHKDITHAQRKLITLA